METQSSPENYFSQVFLVEKKDGDQRPVIYLKGLNQFVEGRTFQDKGPSSPFRSPPARQLDGQDGPEGCIPSDLNPPRPPIISDLLLGTEMLQIHLPAVRPIIFSEGIYQINEASSRFPKTGGMSPKSIPG